MAIIKRVSSYKELFKQLKKHNLLYDSPGHYKLSDKHRRPVNTNIVMRFMEMNLMEKTKALSAWWEDEWRIKHEFRNLKNFKDCINKN